MRTREIGVELRKAFPTLNFTAKQLRNYRHRLRKASLSGYTPFQALKRFLKQEAIAHTTKWKKDPSTREDTGVPMGLFYSPEWCSKQWKLFPWV